MDQNAAFLDIPLELDAVLDRQLITVRRLLDLKSGSIVLTDKSAGEKAKLFIGGVLLGHGDVTVSASRLAFRISGFE
jgi:flagellar motor switch/type III secretory pathway protein FliN